MIGEYGVRPQPWRRLIQALEVGHAAPEHDHVGVEHVDHRAERARQALLVARELRPKPARDDKAIASWNGLLLAALAEAGRRLERRDWLDAATALAEFLLGPLSDGERLHRTWRGGVAKGTASLDDYANVAHGLYELHVATGDLRWLRESRRLALLAWAERTGAAIVEDDYDSEYRYAGRPLEALAALDRSGRVLYAATFSKVMFPSLRLGYMILPERMIEPLRSSKALMDAGGPTLAQAALVDFIRAGHFERHLHRMRTRNASRRAAMLEAIERHLGGRAQVTGVNAGLHLVLWLRDLPVSRARELRMRAARARG